MSPVTLRSADKVGHGALGGLAQQRSYISCSCFFHSLDLAGLTIAIMSFCGRFVHVGAL